LVLLRLREGPLLFVSFADASQVPEPKGLLVSDGEGGTFIGYGMFAALSDDEGESWPLKRLISGDGERRLEGGAWTGGFTMNATHAEPKGYLAATQTPDGVIHLISSRMHYRFNVAWLRQAGGSQKGDSPVPGAEHASVTVHDN
jgi:hypothetical protein